MILKTHAEILHLKELVGTKLDVNRDGVVTDAELQDGYALANDELKSFGIVKAKDLRYWTSVYKPGTEVEKTSGGDYAPVAYPQSIRSKCIAAYESGRLVNEALQIEGNAPTEIAVATQNLKQLEGAWRDFYAARSGAFDSKKFVASFGHYCDDKSWQQTGMDPTAFAGKLNDQELRQLYDGALLLKFLEAQDVTYDKHQTSFLNFLVGDGETHTGACEELTTFGLHLFKLVGNSAFRPMIMTKHVTLCFETSQGLMYMGAAANLGFQAPGYFENQPPSEQVRRNHESPLEPWQVMAAVYNNEGSHRYGEENDVEARRYLEASLEICPENPSAQYLLGATLGNLGDKKGAREHYLKALAINPTYKFALDALERLERSEKK